MDSNKIAVNLVVNLVAGFLILMLSLQWNKVPKYAFWPGISILFLILLWPFMSKYKTKHCLKKFWGPSVLSKRFAIVYGTLEDPRPRVDQQGQLIMRFLKRFQSGETIFISGPFENIVGDCEIRATGYLVQSIGKVRASTIAIQSDTEAIQDLDHSFVSLGSHASNEISNLIMRENANRFYIFNQIGQQVFIESIPNHRRIQMDQRKDFGIIMRIRNTRFPNNYLFLCAGLGEWGTSGAAWYLATKWEGLYKEFKDQDFAVVVGVDKGSDTSAIRVSALD